MECFRCKLPLTEKYVAFLDRKYHRPCAVMTAFFYKQIRVKEKLDEMSLPQLNKYLELRMELSIDEWRRIYEYHASSPLRDRESDP